MIKSVEKAMSILSAVSDKYPDAISLKELSDKLNVPKPTCSHLLDTLCQMGFLHRISQSAGYTLGPETFRLTRYGKYNQDLIYTCHPLLRWLSAKTKQTAILAVLENHQKYIVDTVDGETPVFSRQASIHLDTIYRTATGRLLLANLSERKLKEFWEKHGAPKNSEWEGVESIDDLRARLDEIKKQEIVRTDEMIGGYRYIGYAHAIRNNYKVCGAVGLALRFAPNDPSFTSEYEQSCIDYLIGAAKEATRRICYQDKDG